MDLIKSLTLPTLGKFIHLHWQDLLSQDAVAKQDMVCRIFAFAVAHTHTHTHILSHFFEPSFFSINTHTHIHKQTIVSSAINRFHGIFFFLSCLPVL